MSTRVTAEELHAFCIEALQRSGASDSHAKITSDVLVTTDTWGVFTHGTKLLRDYVKRLRGGGLRTDVEPFVAAGGPAWSIVDGNSCLGHVTSTFAMQDAITRARKSGIAYVGVKNSCHFGAAGYYACLAANEGLIGIAMANDIPSVALTGSKRAVLGSNPLAYAIPTGAGDPILLDMAISTVAGGKVYAANQRGEPIPNNWIIDREGRPTTDSSLYPASASLAFMAGHKGYGIALLIETLSGLMTGASVTSKIGSWIFDDPSKPTDHGAAFLAIDIATIMPRDQFENRIRHLIDEIHSTPTADGVDRMLMPGEREWNHRRKSLAEGIDLPSDVIGKLSALANDLGMQVEWMSA